MHTNQSTKGQSQFYTQVITFSDIDQKSNTSSPYAKSHKQKDNVFPSFGMISDDHSIEMISNSSRVQEIILVRCSNNALTLNQDPSLYQLLSQHKMRFIVQISVTKSKTECISLIEKPILSDNNQCKYYTLRCYICSDQTSMSFYLLRFCYTIAMYFCLLQINEKIVSFITVSLKNMKSPIWKSNSLFLINGQDIQSSTAYESTINAPSLYKSAEGNRQYSPRSHRSNKTMSNNKKTRIDNIKHLMMNHFTNIIPIAHQNRIINFVTQQKTKGLYFYFKDIVTLIDLINGNTLLVSQYQTQVLKHNASASIKRYKKQYSTLSNNIFVSGKSIQFTKLRSLLSQICLSILDSFDRQFFGLEAIQDHEIHRQILKRWIQTKQYQSFEVNSILHESQTTKVIQISMGKGFELQQNIQNFFEKNINQKIKGVDIDSLLLFLKSTYMVSLKKKIQNIQQNNRRRVIRQINYYENPSQMLKNCEQRLNLSNDKRDYLIKCIELVQKQIQNLDNLTHGLSLQQKRQSLKYKTFYQQKQQNTFEHQQIFQTQ